jgi:hypothetical protein
MKSGAGLNRSKIMIVNNRHKVLLERDNLTVFAFELSDGSGQLCLHYADRGMEKIHYPTFIEALEGFRNRECLSL